MFFFISKIVTWCFMPLSQVILLGSGALLARTPKSKKTLGIACVSLLIWYTNPLVANLVINAWEPNPIMLDHITQTYDYGVVLAGITYPDRPPYDRIQFSKGADRIVRAIELYKLGKLKKIIVSGGSGTLSFQGNPESIMIRNFAIDCGVHPDDILTEEKSQNTYQNAQNTSQMLAQNDNILLITSAFHMYRAKSCFEKTNASFDTFPTDYYGQPIRTNPLGWIAPTYDALEVWTKLTKEWLGIAAYKLAGYI